MKRRSASFVARLGAALQHDPFRMYQARDRQSILWLAVRNRVAARDHRACLFHFLSAAAQNFGNNFQRQVFRKCGQVDREQRSAAHRVNIRQGIGCRNGAECVGIVHHRREKIGRLDQRLLGV